MVELDPRLCCLGPPCFPKMPLLPTGPEDFSISKNSSISWAQTTESSLHQHPGERAEEVMITHLLSFPLSPVFTGSQDEGSCARGSAAQGRARPIPGWGQPLTQQDAEGRCRDVFLPPTFRKVSLTRDGLSSPPGRLCRWLAIFLGSPAAGAAL